MAGNYRVIPFKKTLLGKCQQILFGEESPAGCLASATATTGLQGQRPGPVGGHQRQQSSAQSASQHLPQHPIGLVVGVDQVAVGDEYPPVIEQQLTTVGQNSTFEKFAEKRSHVKVMVAFDENQLGSGFALPAQFFQQGNEGSKNRVTVSEPEVEDISKHDKMTNLTSLSGKKRQKPAIIAGGGIEKVGVGEKDIFHSAQI